MTKNLFLIILLSISCVAFSQRVVYSNSVILNIPSKNFNIDTIKSDKNEVKAIKGATIKFVNVIDSITYSDKKIAVEVDVNIDTVFENDEKLQVLKFSFQPIWESIENIYDYPSGVYDLRSSSVSLYLTNIVKETFQKKIRNYIDTSDVVLIKIKGTADAIKIKGIRYKSEFGSKINQYYFFENKERKITLAENRLITKNSELAFLRTLGISVFLESNINELRNFNVKFEHYVEVSDEVGGIYRRVEIEIIIIHKI